MSGAPSEKPAVAGGQDESWDRPVKDVPLHVPREWGAATRRERPATAAAAAAGWGEPQGVHPPGSAGVREPDCACAGSVMGRAVQLGATGGAQAEPSPSPTGRDRVSQGELRGPRLPL